MSSYTKGLLQCSMEVHRSTCLSAHRSVYITMDDRSSWDSLMSQIIPLVRQLAQSEGKGSQRKLTVVAESFGGCLAFRLALAVPQLIANMVVVNSATSFHKSYSGIINLIAASNLLSLFPEQLYQVHLDKQLLLTMTCLGIVSVPYHNLMLLMRSRRCIVQYALPRKSCSKQPGNMMQLLVRPGVLVQARHESYSDCLCCCKVICHKQMHKHC